MIFRRTSSIQLILILLLFIRSAGAVVVNISGPDERVNNIALQQAKSILAAIDLIAENDIKEARKYLVSCQVKYIG